MALAGFGWHAINQVMCRGIACLNDDNYPGAKRVGSEVILPDACALLGSPTGIGWFRNRRFGRPAREILGAEYMFLGREFLFIKSRSRTDLPIIVINANRYLVEIPQTEICADSLSVAVDASINRITVSKN
jgi:hypothetical protein